MNRRSEKLDRYLGKKVAITFNDGDCRFNDGDGRIGVLGWNEDFKPLMLLPQMYYLRYSDGTHLSFRKSNVKSIKEVR